MEISGQGHEKLEEDHIFPILDQVYGVSVSEAGPERMRELAEKYLNVYEYVKRQKGS